MILDSGAAGRIISWIQILLFSAGLAATAAFAIRDRRARVALSAWAVVFVGVTLIRNVTPVWMTGALYAVSAGAAAFGLPRLLVQFGHATWGVAIALAVLPVLVLLTVLIRLTAISTDGDLRLPNHATVDVKRSDLTPGESFGYLPAWAHGRLLRVGRRVEGADHPPLRRSMSNRRKTDFRPQVAWVRPGVPSAEITE